MPMMLPKGVGIGRLFDDVRDAVVAADPRTGRIVFWNEAATEIFGYSRSEALELDIAVLFPESARSAQRRAVLDQHRKTGHGLPCVDSKASLDLPALRKGGAEIRIEMTLSLIRGADAVAADGNFVLIIARDATARKRTEEALRESEERIRLLENAQDVVYRYRLEPDRGFEYVSPSVATVTGYTPEEHYADPNLALELVHPDERYQLDNVTRSVAPSFDPPLTLRWRRKDGEVIFLEHRYKVVPGPGGTPAAIEGIARDVTERERAEGEIRWLERNLERLIVGRTAQLEDLVERLRENERVLRRSEERFRALVQHASVVVTILEADGTITYESPAVERVLGYRPEELVGTNAFDRVHPDDFDGVSRVFADDLANGGAVLTPVEYRFRHADGSWRYLESVGNNLSDDPSVGGIVINSRDVTERKALEERLAYQAFHDSLTDLPNRALFMDRLGHSLARAERRGGRVALLFADLDNLKQINDCLGHRAGDEVLKAVAGRLRSGLRPGDTAARFGGDEFVVLLEEVAEAVEATRVAERVLEALRFPFARRGRNLLVTASVGVALSAARAHGGSPEALLREADRAMYRVKRSGKGRYAIIYPDTDAAPGHPTAGNDLGRAPKRASSPYRTSGG